MKKFFKCLFDGILATVVAVLITVIIWAFLTLTAIVIIGSAPVWVIVFARMAAKVSSFGEFTTKALDDLERILNNAK